MKKMGTLGREIRIAVIGVGSRGIGQLQTLVDMPDVKVAVVCDKYEDRIKAALDACEKTQGFRPDGTKNYLEAVVRDDIEAVVVMTSWTTHIRIALAAMRAGKYVAMEVGGATNIDECWQLVRTSEETGMPCMLLENCCYNLEEMTLLNMIKKGIFGEIISCEGGYEHDLRSEIGNGDVNRHYRMENFFARNGELYPTHELGPIAKYLNINRGNRMLHLTSMSSKAVGLREWLKENRADTDFPNHLVNEGDIVKTLIKCANGELITLTHACSLPRPYSRGGYINGTKGCWTEERRSIFLDKISKVDTWEEDKAYIEKYKHPLWKEYEEFGLRGGHGGMDYLCLRAFVESVQERKPTPIDVYDAATWMSITCLSEQSVSMGGMPVPIPDFTSGDWIGREDIDKGMYSLDIIPE